MTCRTSADAQEEAEGMQSVSRRVMYICILGDEEKSLLHRNCKMLDHTGPSRIIREHLTRPAPEEATLCCGLPVASGIL
jgi:hypothetical protein